MIIKNTFLFSISILICGIGIVGAGVKLATSKLVIMDDAEFLLPFTVSLVLGIIGSILLSSSLEKSKQ